MERKETLVKIAKTVFGLFVFSLGEYCTILGNIGYTPWDSLSMALTRYIPLSFGKIHVATAVAVMIIDLLMKEKIGLGTVLDALLVGNFVDLWGKLLPFEKSEKLLTALPIVIIGLFIMAAGQVFYMSGGLSCGPRDTLMVGLGKRLKKLPIGLVDIILKISLVTVSFLIGGKIGLGTLIAMFGIGTSMQIVYGLFKFEPRDIVHENILTSIRKLI